MGGFNLLVNLIARLSAGELVGCCVLGWVGVMGYHSSGGAGRMGTIARQTIKMRFYRSIQCGVLPVSSGYWVSMKCPHGSAPGSGIA